MYVLKFLYYEKQSPAPSSETQSWKHAKENYHFQLRGQGIWWLHTIFLFSENYIATLNTSMCNSNFLYDKNGGACIFGQTCNIKDCLSLPIPPHCKNKHGTNARGIIFLTVATFCCSWIVFNICTFIFTIMCFAKTREPQDDDSHLETNVASFWRIFFKPRSTWCGRTFDIESNVWI